MRLDRLISNSGYGTRSQIKDLIRSKRVLVNGTVITDAGFSVTEEDTISIDGESINAQKYLYYLFDKPDGVLTAMEDKRLPTVADFVPENLKTMQLSPVGRLDFHTTGLLLLTNDGELSHRLTGPKFHVPKTYVVTYEGDPLDASIVLQFESGLTLTDMKEGPIKLKPARLELLSDNSCKITLFEGKTHQVRRMLAHFDRSVITLSRIAIGPIKLNEPNRSGSGLFTELSCQQRQALLQEVKLDQR